MVSAPSSALRWAVLTGVSASIGQLLRIAALKYGSVIVVTLMQRTSPLWILFFVFIFNRRYESLSRWVLVGNGALMAGTLLVLVS